MNYTMFAAIEVGSSEISMKIYELSKKNGIKELDYIRQPIEIGAETYSNKRLSYTVINKICETLHEYKRIMAGYNAISYRAVATSAIREAINGLMVLDRIKISTGFNVDILSNSEKRFLHYKSISFRGEVFDKIIQKSTAIVDVSAGSLQISLYNKDALVSTQNIKLGFLRIMEAIADFSYNTDTSNRLINEYINSYLNTYKEQFLDEANLVNIIAVGDNINELARLIVLFKKSLSKDDEFFKEGFINREFFEGLYNKLLSLGDDMIAKELGIRKEQATFLLPTAMIYKKMFEITNAEKMWFPRVQLNDGMAVDYAEKYLKIHPAHDFSADIILAARNIANRYHNDVAHTKHVEKIALNIFDSLSKVHGMKQRERLIVQLAAILHNCGAFINMNEVPVNSYNIVMSTEIIGLSHKERELVADVIKYMTYDIPRIDELHRMDKKSYITITKIVAILRLANSMDKSHRQKFNDITIRNIENTMIIEVKTLEDITLEKGLFNKRAEFFREVYGIKPKLKHINKNSI